MGEEPTPAAFAVSCPCLEPGSRFLVWESSNPPYECPGCGDYLDPDMRGGKEWEEMEPLDRRSDWKEHILALLDEAPYMDADVPGGGRFVCIEWLRRRLEADTDE